MFVFLGRVKHFRTPKLKTSSLKISSCFCLQVCGDMGSHPSATSHLTPLLPPTFASYCYHGLMQKLKSELIVRNSWNFVTFRFDFPFFSDVPCSPLAQDEF
jgi:hypothetical protein